MDPTDLIDELIAREGGYVANPADKGGPTCFGITQAVAHAHGYTGAMARLPRVTAVAIYRADYWTAPGLDQVAAVAPLVAAELFDTGVNMGSARPPASCAARSMRSIAAARTIATSPPPVRSTLPRSRR